MRKFVISVSFCQEIRSLCKKSPQIDTEIVEIVLSFLMQYLYNFGEFSLEVPTQSKAKERALHYIF